MLAKGIVSPTFTIKEIEQMFARRRTGVVQVLVDKISELSGFEEDARKLAMQEFLGQPES